MGGHEDHADRHDLHAAGDLSKGVKYLPVTARLKSIAGTRASA